MSGYSSTPIPLPTARGRSRYVEARTKTGETVTFLRTTSDTLAKTLMSAALTEWMDNVGVPDRPAELTILVAR